MSSLTDMSPGTSFKPILGDSTVKNKDRYTVYLFICLFICLFVYSVERIVLCSGKHYYALDNYRKENNIENVPIIRIEVSRLNHQNLIN